MANKYAFTLSKDGSNKFFKKAKKGLHFIERWNIISKHGKRKPLKIRTLSTKHCIPLSGVIR